MMIGTPTWSSPNSVHPNQANATKGTASEARARGDLRVGGIAGSVSRSATVGVWSVSRSSAARDRCDSLLRRRRRVCTTVRSRPLIASTSLDRLGRHAAVWSASASVCRHGAV